MHIPHRIPLTLTWFISEALAEQHSGEAFGSTPVHYILLQGQVDLLPTSFEHLEVRELRRLRTPTLGGDAISIQA